MMYGEIQGDPPDVDLQRILWIPSHGKEVKYYQLLTVTGEENCSPYYL